MKTNKGFSLVELIVVIAIMAIIAAVAVPVYNVYIDKANKAADEQLVGDIKYALTLALASDTEHEFAGSVAVMLNSNGTATIQSTANNADDVAFVENIMVETYGDDWATVCALKYTGWTGGTATDIVTNYKDSSFSGKENALIEQVGNLTGAMADFFAGSTHNIPESLQNYLDKNGVASNDATGVANSTVLVFADTFNTSGKTSEEIATINAAKENITEALVNSYSSNGATLSSIGDAYRTIYTSDNDENMVLLAQAATIYAFAEAYCQYAATNGYTEALNTLHSVGFEGTSSGAAALGKVFNAFGQIVNDINSNPEATALTETYFDNGQAEKDAKATFSVLDAVNSSSDVLSSDLSNPNFYNDGKIADLLNAYIAVGSLNVADGQASVVVNANESVVVYLGGLRE